MKRMLVAMILMSGVAVPAGAQRPRLGGAEAPRATDLLRAETLAEKAEKRLRPPSRKGAGWLHGGSGWDDDGAAVPAGPDPVIIHLHPSRRHAPRP